MPQHGHYKAKLATDDSDPLMWELVARLHRDDGEVTPLGWTPEYGMLVAILEAITQGTSVLIACNSQDGQVPDSQRIPRPVTALDKAIARQRHTDREARVRKLVPHVYAAADAAADAAAEPPPDPPLDTNQ